jgi:hypothetical protein
VVLEHILLRLPELITFWGTTFTVEFRERNQNLANSLRVVVWKHLERDSKESTFHIAAMGTITKKAR